MAARPHWKDEPEEHDYPAAEGFLSLIMPVAQARKLARRLRRRPIEHFKAKDLLRASRLALLGPDNPEVAKDLAKVRRGQRLSPVLLVRGRFETDLALTIADGYHRICASYHLNEDTPIPCRLV